MKKYKQILEILSEVPENSYAPIEDFIDARWTTHGSFIRARSNEFLGCSKEWPLTKDNVKKAYSYN